MIGSFTERVKLHAQSDKLLVGSAVALYEIETAVFALITLFSAYFPALDYF
jgi:hypothetical protein